MDGDAHWPTGFPTLSVSLPCIFLLFVVRVLSSGGADLACSFGWWPMLICSERNVLLAGGWFVLREKYCWLVADKPNEQGESGGG
jgi:hypothetical protein